jgi:hypothetical protein
MAERITLTPVNDDDGNRVYYECSKCRVMFVPEPNDADLMPRLFKEHLASEHSSKRKPRADFSQAAAQIIREATERD